MNISAFLTCLGYYGVSTGAATSLEGAYSLSSGTTGIFFNQIYSSGAHFINNQIYAPVFPLINIYSNNIISSGTFSGVNGLRVGYNHTGNFGMILDVSYSGCSRTADQRGMVLVSTASSPQGLSSGFVVGITESNRLYFNTNNYSASLSKELGTRDFVYVSLAEQKYVTFGIYNLNDNKFYKNTVEISSGVLSGQDIYIGNFLSSVPSDLYTGFSGKINQVILFNESLIDDDISICSNCSLATGFNIVSNTYSFLAQQLTGIYFSGVMDYATTGYTNVTGKVVTHDSSTINVITPSGMTTYLQTGQVVIPLFSGITIQGTRDDYAFLYDTTALNSFSTFSLYFNMELSSGDSIEVYTYSQPNVNIGKLLKGIDWPIETGTIQLISNGLNETLDTDYRIVRNQISGFSSEDILSYDVIVAPSIVTAYSGYWNGTSRVLLSGGAFFPNVSQYYENTTNFSGISKITGLSGVCISNPFYPNFGYDLHMNGQKLISGMHYSVVTSGTSGFVVSLSGSKLPELIVYPIYDITGGGPIGVDSVEDSELTFIPEFSGFRQTRIDVTGNKNFFGLFTGFGEQVWINGLRMLNELDYQKTLPCSSITGAYNQPALDFVLYDSQAGNDGLWNITLPPTLYLSTGGTSSISLTPQLTGINGYPTSASCIEVWTSQLINSTTFGSFSYEGVYPYSTISIAYSGSTVPAGLVTKGSGVAIARYHYGNVLGQWTMTAPMTFSFPI